MSNAKNLDNVVSPPKDYCCSIKYIPNTYIEAIQMNL